MSIQLSVDATGLIEKMKRLMELTGTTLKKALYQEGRLLSIELARYTQPFGWDTSAKGKGESAIKGDLLGSRRSGQKSRSAGVFYVLPDSLIDGATMEPGTTNVRLFARKDGTVYGTDKTTFKPDASQQALYFKHQSMRRKSDGTVVGATAEKTIGRWKFIEKWTIRETSFSEYLAKTQAMVGFAKSGWIACAKELAALSGDRVQGVPDWVKRHNAPGHIEDRTSAEKPSLTISNDINYSGRVLSHSNITAAIRDRKIKLQARIDQALKAAAKKLTHA